MFFKVRRRVLGLIYFCNYINSSLHTEYDSLIRLGLEFGAASTTLKKQ